ncbi:flagellar FliJ family protein [Curtobacterium ammoniigenes]|uniref:flagellar FliJ family protein n=1 Tax=Curtobacterium ammoniigenes TaxID=395387 RepID=UPI00082B0A81|nr:hypothetical protein [Curtobacterium ammoniigenes]
MKPFRLAGLLRVRRLQEQLAAADLADANRHAEDVRLRTHRIRASLADADPSHADGAVLAAVTAARSNAQIMLADLAALRGRIETERSDAQAAYGAARTDARVLEKLQERHAAAAAQQERKDEQAVLDEVATTRWRPGTEGHR